MEESSGYYYQQHQQHQQQYVQPSRRRGGAGGVEGGGGGQGAHIVRPAAGRKDRHSKVCTARGLRDRRVRLSAHTAIQFYDVQDRLGFDRPSKAVDWLLKNAQPAIDGLSSSSSPSPHSPPPPAVIPPLPHPPPAAALLPPAPPNSDDFTVALLQHHHHSSLDTDAIADTIKAFFPIGIAAAAAPPSSNPSVYPNYPPDLIARTSGDLHLSLHSSQAPNFHHGGGGGSGDNYMFDFARRDSLQSSDPPSIRACSWFGPGPAHEPTPDEAVAFAGFRVPARIRGDGGFREKLASDAHQ